MAVAEAPISITQSRAGYAVAQAPVEVFLEYLQRVVALPGVREVRWAAEEGEADLYVVVEGIDPPAARGAHLLRRDFSQRYGRMPFTLRVIELGLVDEDDLPGGVVFSPAAQRAHS